MCRWDITGSGKMKKFILLVVCATFSFFANAQKATGTCKLPGAYDYVKVGYYDDGHLAVSNQSQIGLAEIHITVTCTASWKERHDRPDGFGNDRSTWVEKSETITLCDQDFYNIPCCQTTTISDGVKTPSQVKKVNGVKYSDFQVTVGNLICAKL